MARVIAIANQKGGVAKTTTAINLSSSLVKLNRTVLIIDLDPQGNSSHGVGIDSSLMAKTIYDVLTNKYDINKVIKKTAMEGLDVIPANLRLANTEDKIGRGGIKTQYILRDAIKRINKQYDYIIIDCPPAIGVLNTNGLTAANGVLIPVQCEYFAMSAVSQMLSTMRKVQNKFNHNLEIEGIVFTMYDPRTRMAIEVTTEIRKLFKEKTFTTAIPRNIYLPEAAAKGIPITLYKPKSSASLAYLSLAQEVIDNEMLHDNQNKKRR